MFSISIAAQTDRSRRQPGEALLLFKVSLKETVGLPFGHKHPVSGKGGSRDTAPCQRNCTADIQRVISNITGYKCTVP